MTSTAASSAADRIVVGVDGSACSKEALAWAGRQAKRTGAPLVAVATWQLPTSYGWAVPQPESIDFEVEIRSMLDSAIKEMIGEDAGIEVSSTVVLGHPATVLTEMSKAAALVVVGCRGHGEFVGMMIGSVSQHLAAHAFCPVVVVRSTRHPEPSRK